MKMLNEIASYILEFCAYDKEPLHLILSALIERKLVENARYVIPAILNLMHDGYLACYYHRGSPEDKYESVHDLTEKQLFDYIGFHEKQGFEIYPSSEEGGEYYFQTTEKGIELRGDKT